NRCLFRGTCFFLGSIFVSRRSRRQATLEADAIFVCSCLRLRLSHGFHELLSFAGVRLFCPGVGMAWRSRELALRIGALDRKSGRASRRFCVVRGYFSLRRAMEKIIG